jgi:hypothetical protein
MKQQGKRADAKFRYMTKVASGLGVRPDKYDNQTKVKKIKELYTAGFK